MNLEEIRQLIELANESGIAELEVERGGNRVRIRRAMPPQPQEIVFQPVQAAAGQVAVPPPQVASMAPPPLHPIAPAEEAGLKLVKSPIVGTFYESPDPSAPPFVSVGDRVRAGQVLCIIESMKLMNEIEADEAGIIVAKLVENARPVEYGEALFSYRPL